MKKTTVSLLAAGALLVLAAVLNPSADRHREEIEESVGEGSKIARTLRLGALAAFVANYHSLGIASYTRLNGRTASIGVLGLVFVLSGATGRR